MKIEAACAFCEKLFWTKAYLLADGRGKYCSRTCVGNGRMREQIKRFWMLVKKTDGCWIWIGRKDKDGYGRLMIAGKLVRAHRAVWAFVNGPIPDGLQVLHDCPDGDNPACCNPVHLWLGTNADNMADRDAKGRQAKGVSHWTRNGRNKPIPLKTHCKHGHAFSGDNLVIYNGVRSCRACANNRSIAAYRLKNPDWNLPRIRNVDGTFARSPQTSTMSAKGT